MNASKKAGFAALGPVERKIYFVRGQKVMRDSDLARLYQVQTKALNLAVKRNAKRFPDDFMFQSRRRSTIL